MPGGALASGWVMLESPASEVVEEQKWRSGEGGEEGDSRNTLNRGEDEGSSSPHSL